MSYKTFMRLGLLQWLRGKEFTCNAGDVGSFPGSGRFPGEENSNPPQYSCLGNPMDRGAWWAKIHRVAKTEHVHTHTMRVSFHPTVRRDSEYPSLESGLQNRNCCEEPKKPEFPLCWI